MQQYRFTIGIVKFNWRLTSEEWLDMSTKSSLLKLLSDNAGNYISGEKIGEILGVSRTAVNKACSALRSEGYIIESKTNKGYMLAEHGKLLTVDGTFAYINVPCSLRVYDVVSSTNEIAKTAVLPDDPLIIIADRQTAGKGRLGRRFESPAGAGQYMSFVFRPDFDIRKSLYVTMAAAVGTCRAIEEITGKHVEIKWVNDLFLNGKKVCGILTEAQSDLESGTIDRLITGIGVNCYPGSFSPEVSDVAGSLASDTSEFSREILAASMINEILPLITNPDTKAFMDEYRERCFILGHEIKIHPSYSDAGIRARAIDVADDGGLIVEYLEDAKASDLLAASGSAADILRNAKAGAEDVLHTGEISISI